MIKDMAQLRRFAVAVAREDDGHVVECNPRFCELVHGGREAEPGSVLDWLDPAELRLGEDEQERFVQKQLVELPKRPYVGVTVSRGEEDGLVMLEVDDITPRVTAEKQFTWILENTFDGFWDWHIQDDYEYMSPQFWRMFGYEPHEKEHKPSAWQDMVNQDDLKEALANFAKHVESRGKHPYVQEVRYTHKDGSTVWVHCKGHVVEYAEDGSALRMVGTHTDITKLKEQHAEERKLVKCIAEQNDQLKRRADEMHDLIYRANAPVIGFDRKGRITEWNERVAELVGASEGEMIGLRIDSLDICCAGSLETVQRVLASAEAGEPLNHIRLSLRARSDPSATVDLLANLTARKDPAASTPAGGYILGQDLTQMVLAKEDAISAASKASAERDLNEYVAHEVRNPVFAAQAGIRFLTEFLQLPEVAGLSRTPEAAKDALLVSNSLDYIFELLSSLLDLNKFLEGKLAYRSRVVDFGEDILDPVVSMLQRRCASDVTLMASCGKGLIGCCDDTRIKQVLVNLVVNAIKFTCAGFVHIAVTRDSEEEELTVRVDDSGVGVPPESVSMLFKRFSQVAGHDQGSGIGLYLSGLVVKKIGGKLWLDTNYSSGVPGCPGSRFCFRIPFRCSTSSAPVSSASETSSVVVIPEPRSAGGRPLTTPSFSASDLHETKEEREEDKQAQHELTKRVTMIQVGGRSTCAIDDAEQGDPEAASPEAKERPRRLLLVDDEAPVRLMMSRLLARALPELEVEAAVNGEAAIELVTAGNEFDVIVMDHHMGTTGGKLLGTETVAKLREMGVPSLIVGLSGNDVIDEFKAAGADFAWRKPMASRAKAREEILAALAALPADRKHRR